MRPLGLLAGVASGHCSRANRNALLSSSSLELSLKQGERLPSNQERNILPENLGSSSSSWPIPFALKLPLRCEKSWDKPINFKHFLKYAHLDLNSYV